MNRQKLLLVLIALTLTFSAISASFAIFPKPDFPPNGFGLLSYDLQLGSVKDPISGNNTQAWYINQDISTTSLQIACANFSSAWLSNKLSSALEPKLLGGEIAARPMYIVLNPTKTQGPVFSTTPGQSEYSGLWQVFYITWLPGSTPRAILNSDPEGPGNPFGLPTALDATIVAQDTVVQLPIAALGVLGGPWYPAPAGRYRMKQIKAYSDYAVTKKVYLPTFLVFCADCVTNKVEKFIVTIPDVSDTNLADLLGANLAPGLLNMPDSDTQAFYNILFSPQLCQLPIIQECPRDCDDQAGCDFTPIVRLTELGRIGIPISTVINNDKFVQLLLGSGKLINVEDDERMGLLFFDVFRSLPKPPTPNP